MNNNNINMNMNNNNYNNSNSNSNNNNININNTIPKRPPTEGQLKWALLQQKRTSHIVQTMYYENEELYHNKTNISMPSEQQQQQQQPNQQRQVIVEQSKQLQEQRRLDIAKNGYRFHRSTSNNSFDSDNDSDGSDTGTDTGSDTGSEGGDETDKKERYIDNDDTVTDPYQDPYQFPSLAATTVAAIIPAATTHSNTNDHATMVNNNQYETTIRKIDEEKDDNSPCEPIDATNTIPIIASSPSSSSAEGEGESSLSKSGSNNKHRTRKATTMTRSMYKKKRYHKFQPRCSDPDRVKRFKEAFQAAVLSLEKTATATASAATATATATMKSTTRPTKRKSKVTTVDQEQSESTFPTPDIVRQKWEQRSNIHNNNNNNKECVSPLSNACDAADPTYTMYGCNTWIPKKQPAIHNPTIVTPKKGGPIAAPLDKSASWIHLLQSQTKSISKQKNKGYVQSSNITSSTYRRGILTPNNDQQQQSMISTTTTTTTPAVTGNTTTTTDNTIIDPHCQQQQQQQNRTMILSPEVRQQVMEIARGIFSNEKTPFHLSQHQQQQQQQQYPTPKFTVNGMVNEEDSNNANDNSDEIILHEYVNGNNTDELIKATPSITVSAQQQQGQERHALEEDITSFVHQFEEHLLLVAAGADAAAESESIIDENDTTGSSSTNNNSSTDSTDEEDTYSSTITNSESIVKSPYRTTANQLTHNQCNNHDVALVVVPTQLPDSNYVAPNTTAVTSVSTIQQPFVIPVVTYDDSDTSSCDKDQTNQQLIDGSHSNHGNNFNKNTGSIVVLETESPIRKNLNETFTIQVVRSDQQWPAISDGWDRTTSETNTPNRNITTMTTSTTAATKDGDINNMMVSSHTENEICYNENVFEFSPTNLRHIVRLLQGDDENDIYPSDPVVIQHHLVSDNNIESPKSLQLLAYVCSNCSNTCHCNNRTNTHREGRNDTSNAQQTKEKVLPIIEQRCKGSNDSPMKVNTHDENYFLTVSSSTTVIEKMMYPNLNHLRTTFRSDQEEEQQNKYSEYTAGCGLYTMREIIVKNYNVQWEKQFML